jgi:very-short-patch-repair endonuclease
MPDHVVDHRLKSGRWRRILPGVYLTRPEHSSTDLVEAALLYAGPISMLSGAGALKMYDLLPGWPQRFLVLAPPADRRQSCDWLHVRQTNRLESVAPTPMWPRLATVARAVADHCLTLDYLDDVRAITARAVQRKLCTAADLTAELEAGPRRGSALLRDALPDIEAGAWSAPEARAGRALRRARVPRFEQNAPIRRTCGRFFYADFLWRDYRAILELDSREHHFEQPEFERTMHRDLELESLGYSVVHLPSPTRHTEVELVQNVRRWLAGRAASLGLPPPPS